MRWGRTLARGLLAGALITMPSALAVPAAGTATTGPGTASPAAASPTPSLAPWRGGVDLYRAGTFTTQQTWLWCTAAGIQIARNIVLGQHDHSYAGQQRYFDWMRARNRYRLPLSAGVDAQGWTAGFQHFVDARYRLDASSSFDAALRSAVASLRRTGLPVGITVDHGNHAWLLTGFTATADPAATASFTVTSVRVVGPLYGLQSRAGYDMPPDTRLTPAQLRRFFTPWHYAPTRMVWDGRYVSIQPAAAAATGTATPVPSPAASAAPTAPASPGVASPSGRAPGPSPAAPATSQAVAAVAPTATTVAGAPEGPTPAAASSPDEALRVLAVVVAAVLAAGGAALAVARRG